jgi:hypothetical protein
MFSGESEQRTENKSKNGERETNGVTYSTMSASFLRWHALVASAGHAWAIRGSRLGWRDKAQTRLSLGRVKSWRGVQENEGGMR